MVIYKNREWESKNADGYINRKIIKEDGTRTTITLHRQVWIDHNGEIPKGYVIHHKDGDILNNDINNLEMIKLEEHIKLHWEIDKKQRIEKMKETWSDRTLYEKRISSFSETQKELWKREEVAQRRKDGLKRAWKNRPFVYRECQVCNNKFRSQQNTALTCSAKCTRRKCYLRSLNEKEEQKAMNF